MNIINDIKQAYNKANIVEKIIYLNVVLFLISALFSKYVVAWLGLPTSLNEFITKPWTILTYGFIHIRLFHVLSNLLVLYYIGNMFLSYYTKKQFLNFYFLGILVGGLAFLLNYYIRNKTGSPLVGASAGVSTIFVAMATKMPRYNLQLRFIGSVELWVLAVIWVGLSILQLANVDNGGAIAHIAGAAFGFIYAKQLSAGNDIGKWFENSIGFFNNLFKQKPKSNLKTVHKSKRWKAGDVEKTKQKKINDILDKISKSGYESLNQEEKDYLFRSGKK